MRKQLLFTLVCFALSYSTLSQTSTWTLNGNYVGSDAKIGTNTSFDLILETSNTERFRITDDGKIGIGLASPLHKFDLLGNMRVQGDLFLTQISEVQSDYSFIGLDSEGKVIKLMDSDLNYAKWQKLTSLNRSITIFPNPNSGIFSIQSESSLDQITIFNQFGEIVFELKTDKSTISISMSSFPSGLYSINAGLNRKARFIIQ